MSLKPTFKKARVLITVMTYPHPSEAHQELVCTAGLTETGDWVRLYPIDYRYRPSHQRFHKYQWVELGLADRGAGNDTRKESRRPDLDSIQLLGPPLSTADNWRARREIVDSLPHYTALQLRDLYETEKTSLGIVRPTEVLDLKVESADRDWKPEWQATLNQFNLFSGQPKYLAKLPYKFSYVFRCEDSGDRVHSAMIEDWELGVLYLNEVGRLGNEEAAVASVKNKFFTEICHGSRDTRFFMGTIFPYNTWVVIGVFWPPKVQQESLFKTLGGSWNWVATDASFANGTVGSPQVLSISCLNPSATRNTRCHGELCVIAVTTTSPLVLKGRSLSLESFLHLGFTRSSVPKKAGCRGLKRFSCPD